MEESHFIYEVIVIIQVEEYRRDRTKIMGENGRVKLKQLFYSPFLSLCCDDHVGQ